MLNDRSTTPEKTVEQKEAQARLGAWAPKQPVVVASPGAKNIRGLRLKRTAGLSGFFNSVEATADDNADCGKSNLVARQG